MDRGSQFPEKKAELLAPAGSAEAFYGAVHAGADAVYLGGTRFGARAYADNFTEKELTACIRYAHLFGRKVYLTVNTLMKEAEMEELFDYLLPFYEAGLDGVIVQDIGALSYIREHFPALELHISTQMSITGFYGAELMKKMGACRVVPARELSLEELKALKESSGLALETFIHGAMCYCYSGQCLFSSILGGRSGNRGRCAQPCRLPYAVQTKQGCSRVCYPLSLKDMCTIEFLPELIAAGIDSFKIEGRMKKPEYAAGVTAIYRKYIDLCYEIRQKGGDYKVSPKDMEALSSLYIRTGRQEGYYHRRNGREMVTLQSPAYGGTDQALLSEIRKKWIDSPLQMPVFIRAVFQTGKPASVTFSHENISVEVQGEVVQSAQKHPITRDNIEKQLGKLGDSCFFAGYQGEAADSAAGRKMEIQVSPDAFYPLKQINELRRTAVCLLQEAILKKRGYKTQDRKANGPEDKQKAEILAVSQREAMSADRHFDGFGGLSVSVQTKEQLEKLADVSCGVSRFYVNGDLFFEAGDEKSLGRENRAFPEQVLSLCRRLKDNAHVFLSLPPILRRADYPYLEGLLRLFQEHEEIFLGFQVRSLEALGFLMESQYYDRCRDGFRGKIFTDAGIYCFNHWSLKGLLKETALDGFCLPYELNAGEQRSMASFAHSMGIVCEKPVYGHIPVMVTANCAAKTTVGCVKGKEERIQLLDRYGKHFPVVLNCIHCFNLIYNSVPLSLHREISRSFSPGWKTDKWMENCDLRLDFTIEEGEEAVRILRYFEGLVWGNASSITDMPPFAAYTTGHEKRGVL